MITIIGMLMLPGCSPDTSKTEAALQCTTSGGAWSEVSECPNPCVIPAPSTESCENIYKLSCATVCGDAPACDCPYEKPFWQEGIGCVGFEACPEGEADTGSTD